METVETAQEGPTPGADIFTGGAIGHESELGTCYKKAVPMDQVYDVIKELLINNHGATIKKQQEQQKNVLAGIVSAIMRFIKWIFAPIIALFTPKEAAQ